MTTTDTKTRTRKSAAERKAERAAADQAAREAREAAEAQAAKDAQDAAETPDAETPDAPPAGEPETPPAEPGPPEAAGEPEAAATEGEPGWLAEFAGKLPALPEPKAPGQPRAAAAAREPGTWPAYQVDELVGIRSKPGQRFTIVKVNPESLVLVPEGGGDKTRVWKAFITEAPVEGQEAPEALAPGSLAKWTARPQPDQGVATGDLVVILADQGNTINAAKLGGHQGKTLHRSPRHCFEPVPWEDAVMAAYEQLVAADAEPAQEDQAGEDQPGDKAGE